MKNLLIDGNNLVHRAYWIANSRGGVSHLSIVLTAVKSYVEQFSPGKIYCAWDMRKSDEKAFRKQESGEYKQTRDDDYNAQVHELTDVIEKMFSYLGIINVYPGQGEADDIIFWLSKYIDGENVIISADTDLLQLIDDKTVVFSPVKKVLYDSNTFFEKYQIYPEQYCLYKCITGDKSDNIIGIDGFGNKRSLAVVRGDVTLTAEQREIVYNNMKLINLDNTGIKNWDEEYQFYQKQLDDYEDSADFDKFKNICEKFNLNNILKQESKWHDAFFMKSAVSNIIEQLFA